MKTREECDHIAEESIVTYCADCEVGVSDDLRKALELLVSKAARGIEKYCGREESVNVLRRTIFHIQGGN